MDSIAFPEQREYRPMAPESVLHDIAVERVCTSEALSSFIELAGSEREASEFFGPVSTKSLVEEILLKERATDAQIAAGWKELRRRFLEDQAGEIAKEMEGMRDE